MTTPPQAARRSHPRPALSVAALLAALLASLPAPAGPPWSPGLERPFEAWLGPDRLARVLEALGPSDAQRAAIRAAAERRDERLATLRAAHAEALPEVRRPVLPEGEARDASHARAFLDRQLERERRLAAAADRQQAIEASFVAEVAALLTEEQAVAWRREIERERIRGYPFMDDSPRSRLPLGGMLERVLALAADAGVVPDDETSAMLPALLDRHHARAHEQVQRLLAMHRDRARRHWRRIAERGSIGADGTISVATSSHPETRREMVGVRLVLLRGEADAHATEQAIRATLDEVGPVASALWTTEVAVRTARVQAPRDPNVRSLARGWDRLADPGSELDPAVRAAAIEAYTGVTGRLDEATGRLARATVAVRRAWVDRLEGRSSDLEPREAAVAAARERLVREAARAIDALRTTLAPADAGTILDREEPRD